MGSVVRERFRDSIPFGMAESSAENDVRTEEFGHDIEIWRLGFRLFAERDAWGRAQDHGTPEKLTTMSVRVS